MATTIISGTDASTANALWTLMKPLKHDIKVYLIHLLQQSLVEEKRLSDKEALFSKIKGAWKKDGITAEEEILSIRTARTQGLTRNIQDL